MRSILYFLISLLLLNACNSREDKANNLLIGSGMYAQIQGAILKPKCVGCHSPSKMSGNIDLSSYKALMNSGVVAPGEPENSSLYKSVESGKMPKNESPLSSTDLALISNWIKQGALEVDGAPVKWFESISTNTLQGKCVVCHNTVKPRGKVDLSSYEALMASPGDKTKPVVPGDPESSSVFKVLKEAKMPPAKRLFSDDEVVALTTWIQNGALEKTPGALPQPPPGAPNPPQPTYEWLSKNSFRRCGSCHGVPFKVAGIDFTNYATLMASKGKEEMAVVAGSPDKSGILLEAMEGKMPPDPKVISKSEIEAVEKWILKGAKNE